MNRVPVNIALASLVLVVGHAFGDSCSNPKKTSGTAPCYELLNTGCYNTQGNAGTCQKASTSNVICLCKSATNSEPDGDAPIPIGALIGLSGALLSGMAYFYRRSRFR